MKMFSAALSSSNITVSWCTATMPAACESCAQAELLRLPIHAYLAGIARVDAGEQLDQRRLAGAVLADQRECLAGTRVEVDALESMGGAKCLCMPRSVSKD